jgi:uncharacterized repeat protein (TIGR01451 family)/gliding motility-associated-like protein
LTNQEEKTGVDDPSTPANPNGKITDPLNVDTDGDGVTDAQEAIDGTDPTNPCSFKLSSQTVEPSITWKNADCDGDGESNELEKANGTDLLEKCSNSIPFPSPTITSSGSIVCSGTPITLTSSAAVAYQWYKDGAAVNGATSQDFVAYESGSYTVSVLNSLGCSKLSETPEEVIVSLPPTANILEGVILAMNSSCDETPITLTLQTNVTGATYQWTKNGTDIPGETNISYNATEAGLYSVKISNGGCTTESAPTKILPAADAQSTLSPVVCEGDAVELSLSTSGYSASATYQWKKDGVSISAANEPIYFASQAGNYSIVVVDGGVSTESCAIAITVNTPPMITISVSPASIICAGDSTTITADVTGSAPFTYKWRINGTEMNPETSSSFKTEISGVFDVIVADSNGCRTISSPTTVVVNPLPAQVIASVTSQPTCNIPTGTITVTSPATESGMTYSIDGSDYANSTGVFENVLPGTYIVTAKNSSGCVGPSASVTIDAQPFIPAQPDLISGPVVIFPNTVYEYSVTPVAGATSYTWTLPNGWIGTSNTNTISVTVSTNGGTLSVVANTGACVSTASSLEVNVDSQTDTDGDGVIDSKEISDGSNPNDPCDFVLGSVTLSKGNAWNNADCDGDGVTNGQEITDGTNPSNPCQFTLSSQTLATSEIWNNADCDGDGVTNGQEITDGTSPSNPCQFTLSSQTLATSTAWKNADCDGDGVTNGKEITDGTSPSDPCQFTLTSQTLATSTAWKNADCDGDGVTNGKEITDRTNPNDPCRFTLASQTVATSAEWNNADCDGDGVTNGQEIIENTSPSNPCQFILGSQTVEPNSTWKNSDCDGDGVTNQEEPEPEKLADINLGTVNSPIKGSVADNDTDIVSNTYGVPVSDPSNPPGAVLTMKSDGTYTFLSPLAGVFKYMVPVCPAGQKTGCPMVPLEIMIFDDVVGESPSVNLRITKTTILDSWYEGDTVEYIIPVENLGTLAASKIVVKDLLPEGLKFVSTSVDGVIEIPTLKGREIIWEFDSLPAGSSKEILLKTKILSLRNNNEMIIVNNVSVSSNEVEQTDSDNTASAEILVKELFIPNVITPNGDGSNDQFEIKGLNKFLKNELVIFDRWGDYVFKQSDYQNDWAAKGLSTGTFFYLLTGVDENGELHEFKGWIQVIMD